MKCPKCGTGRSGSMRVTLSLFGYLFAQRPNRLVLAEFYLNDVMSHPYTFDVPAKACLGVVAATEVGFEPQLASSVADRG